MGESGYPLWAQVVVVILFTPVFFAGVLGNLMVIVQIFRNRGIQTVTNIFISQLAVGDLMVVLCCLPFTIPTIYITGEWLYGLVWCKAVLFIQTAGCFISIITLVAMSAERYFVLLRPMQARELWTKSSALKIGGAIYIMSGLLAVPRTVFGGIIIDHIDPETGEVVEEEDKKNGTVYDINSQCWDHIPSTFYTYYTIFRIVFMYVIPATLIAIFYAKIAQHLQKTTMNDSLSNDKVIRTRRKVIRMLLAMIGVFILCWMPVYVVGFLDILPTGTDYTQGNISEAVLLFVCVLTVYSSCISNPILYTFMSSQYRSAFRKMLRCGRRRKKHDETQKTTTTSTDGDAKTKSELVSSSGTS